MEDQQPDPGDLSADSAEAPKTPVGKADRGKTQPAAPADEASPEGADEVSPQGADEASPQGADEASPAVGDVASPQGADEASPEGGDEASPETTDGNRDDVVLVPHRPAGRRLMLAAVVAAVLFVGSAGFAGAMVQPYLSERALVATKLEIAQTAAEAITTLWTYTPEDMATLADRASRYLAGDFSEEYARYIDAIVEPNKQAQVTNNTQVVGAAVESVSPPDSPQQATAIVYTNSVATSPVTKNIPSLRYLSYRLTMERDGSQWLITRMSTVTSFDLTPQL
ncbi:mammalian cell entry protein [Mycolicibacterium sp. OfavD-34-C]|uniref:mammalian cell entry protein n=1 Tax=Mycolicibacterium sp. OfavD-34-C TaxID=2917746 RepID=UPI001EF568F0|nr:mammalian cell entry protein [Mycolicibacterium sp. OfavD-34-C]MCG7581731.1 mammalian cell entry protein [Mycolicibacterium sp. OfavD-34-C]